MATLEYKSAVCSPFLICRIQASFSLLDLPWVPKGGFKQLLIREGREYRKRGEIKQWYSLEIGSQFLLKEIRITMSFEFFYRTGAATQMEDGNFRLNTRFLEHSSVASPPANQKKKKITNPAALTPNVASCFWGPVMTILLGLLFGPCLFHL